MLSRISRLPVHPLSTQYLNSFSFSAQKDTKIYSPILPLTIRYPPLYLSTSFLQDKLTLQKTNWYLYIPALGMLINNFLTQWSYTNTAIFVALGLGGKILNSFFKVKQSEDIGLVQVDAKIENLYIAVKGKIFGLEGYQIDQQQLTSLVNSYHPVKQKHPDTILSSNRMIAVGANNNQSQKIKACINFSTYQSQLSRFKIPLKKATLSIPLPYKQKPIFERDLDRLSPKQLIKKYENHAIRISIPVHQDSTYAMKIKLPIRLNILMQYNQKRRFHDYLVALALGFNIDRTGNAVFQDVTKDPIHEEIRVKLKEFKGQWEQKMTGKKSKQNQQEQQPQLQRQQQQKQSPKSTPIKNNTNNKK